MHLSDGTFDLDKSPSSASKSESEAIVSRSLRAIDASASECFNWHEYPSKKYPTGHEQCGAKLLDFVFTHCLEK